MNPEQFPLLFAKVQDFAAHNTASSIEPIVAALSNYVAQSVGRDLDQAMIFLPLTQLEEEISACHDTASLRQLLRRERRRRLTALIVAQQMNPHQTLTLAAQWSEFAERVVRATVCWLQRDLAQAWGQALNTDGHPAQLLVIGMGKLGGGELNFSSDIDLIFSYLPQGITSGGKRSIDHEVYFNRVARALVSLLADVDENGFVFRVDTRLRPFGDSGALVLSLDALSRYYHEHGRGWERFAMVKARCLSGTPAEAKQLMSELRQFVYRRYLDFSMLEEPMQIKLRIEAELRRRDLDSNIKLGMGGIREVEFVAQSLQVIHGGRLPQLQIHNTCAALERLVECRKLEKKAAKILREGYIYLRYVEHLLQSFDDQQTQNLPHAALDRERLAYLAGCPDWAALLEKTNHQRAQIHAIFSATFMTQAAEPVQVLDSELSDIWLIPDDNATAPAALERLGFERPQQSLQMIASLHARLYRRKSRMGRRGRRRLDQIIPSIIQLAGTHNTPHNCLARTLRVIEAISGRTAYLDLLANNPVALELLVDLVGRSEWITAHIAQHPIVIDELLSPERLKAPLVAADMRATLSAALARVVDDDDEVQLQLLSEFKQTLFFQYAAALVSGNISIERLGRSLADIADTVVVCARQIAANMVARRHGRWPHDAGQPLAIAVVAMGKLGSSELGFSSDLDLVFLYQDSEHLSAGPRPLTASNYAIKMAQKLLHVLTTQLSSGRLFEVDTRLRPSGNSGLLVTEIEQFATYQAEHAWTWEHQSLIKARLICGSDALSSRFEHIRLATLKIRREEGRLRQQVRDMRARMLAADQGAPVDLIQQNKQGPGGLVDIEFLAQYLVLRWAADYPRLAQHRSTEAILVEAESCGLLDASQRRQLIDSYRQQLSDINRLALFDVVEACEPTKPLSTLEVLRTQGLYPWSADSE